MKLVSLLACFCFTALAQAPASDPQTLGKRGAIAGAFRFDAFPAIVYTGDVAMPIFKNVQAGGQPWPDGDFRCIGENEELRRRFFADKKPNFAGDWIFDRCTCGTGCSYPFMWNARTGAVHRDFPVHALFSGDLYSNSRGFVYRADSRLLIIEGYVDEVGARGSRSYFEWNGHQFVQLRRMALATL